MAPPMDMRVNEQLHDAAVRHQVWLQRYGGTAAKHQLEILDGAQRELEQRIRGRIEKLGPVERQVFGQGLATTQKMQKTLEEIRVLNRDLRVALSRQLKDDLRFLADTELDIADRRINEAIGVDMNNFRPSPEVMRSLASGARLRGRTLGQWFNKFQADRFARVESAVRLGLVEGDTLQGIVRRLRQAGEASRISAEALARTSVNHVANTAREALYRANTDVIKGVRWTATLDGRTSAICRARDGEVYPVDEPHPRPPAHPRCRSTLTPVTKSWDELRAERGKAPLKRGRGARDIEGLVTKNLDQRGLTAVQIAAMKRQIKDNLDGLPPGPITYEKWLRRQPAEFQDDVLGPTKGRLFRRGDLPLDKFVDMRSGQEFTLDDLKRRESEAWAKAGLDEEVTA